MEPRINLHYNVVAADSIGSVFHDLQCIPLASIFISIPFYFQNKQRGASGSELLPRCVEMSFALGIIFACCEFGHKLSEAFDQIDYYIIGKLRWYNLPMYTRKMLPIVIMSAQEPATLNVFGSISCTRVDFKTVC